MITSSLEVITPEKAKGYLEMNTKNYRFLNRAKVAQYAEDMRSGNWSVNGETIVFGADGVLKDGQHRLAAIVESDKPGMFLVVRGVDNDVNLFDMGSNRSLKQIAKADGRIVEAGVIAAANILYGGFHNSGSKGVVKKYIYDHLDELSKAADIAQRGRSNSMGRRVSCCLSVYCLRRLEMVNDSIMSDFFWVFNNQNIQPEQKRNPSPALVAAKQFSAMSVGASGKMKKFQMAIVLQALNDFRNNRTRMKAYIENDKIVEDLITKIRNMDGIQTTVF